MAIKTYKLSDIPNLENQITNLGTQATSYEDRIRTSPTGLGSESTPTAGDISNQESLNRINKEIKLLQDARLRTKWYPPTDPNTINTVGESTPKQGFIGKTIDFISRPLYGVAGVAKHIAGQGSDSLGKDVVDNILKDKSTFGDILRTANTPKLLAAPLGFALDMMFDPVSWATMGTGALIPKMGVGLYKGGIKGVGLAAKASVLSDANWTARLVGKIPGVKGLDFTKRTLADLGERSIKATEKFNIVRGKTAEEIILENTPVGWFGDKLKKATNDVIDAIPNGKGRDFLSQWVYDPVEWVRLSHIKDVFERTLGTNSTKSREIAKLLIDKDLVGAKALYGETLTKGGRSFENIPVITEKLKFNNIEPEDITILKKNVDSKVAEISGKPRVVDMINENASKISNDISEGLEIATNPNKYISPDQGDNAIRMAADYLKGVGNTGFSIDDLKAIYNNESLDISGVAWFDNMMKGIRNFKIESLKYKGETIKLGERVLDVYAQSMGLFKVFKVANSPTAWVNAFGGNLVMTQMSGANIGPEFMGMLKDVFAMYRNTPGGFKRINDMLIKAGGNEDYVRKVLAEFKTASGSSFGKSIPFMIGGGNQDEASIISGIKELKGALIKTGKATGFTTIEELRPSYLKMIGEIDTFNKLESGTTITREAAAAGDFVGDFDKGTGQISEIISDQPAVARMFEHIEKRSKDKDALAPFFKALNLMTKTIPSGYEQIDQIFKFSTFMMATTKGYTPKELSLMKNFIKFDPEELALGRTSLEEAKIYGEYRYKLSPKTAINLSNEMYLNYAAMPAAVRVLRSIPLLSSPFISFMYGMALKTGKTMVYNPAVFTRTNFALEEFGGQKTPLEKKALQGKFYSYLDKPGMYKLPFFRDNPIYLNLENMIPYYSLNIFNPSKVNYGDTIPQQLATQIQTSPFAKDPLGNAIVENFIIPLILRDSARVQGQFGQPLYPLDANGWEKLLYGTRNLSESFVPGFFGYAGLITPEAAIPYAPLYRWRAIAEAKEGKNQLGISTKENPAAKTVRELFKATGIPVQSPVNLTYNPKE